MKTPKIEAAEFYIAYLNVTNQTEFVNVLAGDKVTGKAVDGSEKDFL